MKMCNIGVYGILNIVNNKWYIGSAVNILSRWRTHKSYLRRGFHGNGHLQASWNKYGEQAFEFKILQITTKEDLITTEQNWINWFKSNEREYGYNLAPVAGNCLGVKHSDEVKAAKSISSKGRKHSLETKKLLSDFMIGNKRGLGKRTKARSLEHCIKISVANKGKKQLASTIEKRKLSNSGFKHSQETKKILSLMKIGNVSGRKEVRWPCFDGYYCKCDDCLTVVKFEQFFRNAKRHDVKPVQGNA